MSPELISDSRGLWCTADTPSANGIYWRLPNGVILPEVNALYSEYGIKTIAVDRRSKNIGLGIFVVDNSKLMEGVHECSVLDLHREGEITMVNVWLARGTKLYNCNKFCKRLLYVKFCTEKAFSGTFAKKT